MMPNNGPTALEAHVDPGLQLLPGPLLHADLAAAAVLSAANEQRAAAVAQVALAEDQRLVNPESRSPQHDD